MNKRITRRVICPHCQKLVGVVGQGHYRRHPMPDHPDTICPISGLPVSA